MSRRKSKKAKKTELIVFGIIVFILFAWSNIKNDRADIEKPVTVDGDGIIQTTFIDVGQGDSALVTASNGERILIDGGDKGSGDVLRAYFADNSVSKLDAAIVSHYHSDHAEGIYELLDEFPIEVLYMPDVKNKPELHDDLKERASENGVEIEYIDAGDTIQLDDGTVFNVLFPDANLYTNDDENINNDSLIIKLSYGDIDFLFTGDLESDAEKLLAKRYGAELDSEVLKVGHHGSKTSSSVQFLNAVSPRFAIICAGEDNRYKHPHGEVLDRYKKCEAEIYRTDLNGNIVIRADANSITEIVTEKN